MNILFRVDAGGATGLGHFYRSLNLAGILLSRGHRLWFCHLDSEFWKKEAEALFARYCSGFALSETRDAPVRDFSVQESRLPGSLRHFVLKPERANEETLALIERWPVDLLYVDGNQEFSPELALRIKQQARLVFYQNLSASRKLADLYILPSIHQGIEFFSDFSLQTRVARGLDYTMFHPELAQVRPKSRQRIKWQSLALSAGGSDPANTLLRLYGMLKTLDALPARLLFFYGKDYMHHKEIPADIPAGWEFRPFSHQEILQQDALLTAFGVSAYEFLYLGMPLLAYGHQESTAHASGFLAGQSQAFVNLGNIEELEPARLQEAIDRLGQYAFRRELSQKARALMDLRGPERVAGLLEETYNSRVL